MVTTSPVHYMSNRVLNKCELEIVRSVILKRLLKEGYTAKPNVIPEGLTLDQLGLESFFAIEDWWDSLPHNNEFTTPVSFVSNVKSYE